MVTVPNYLKLLMYFVGMWLYTIGYSMSAFNISHQLSTTFALAFTSQSKNDLETWFLHCWITPSKQVIVHTYPWLSTSKIDHLYILSTAVLINYWPVTVFSPRYWQFGIQLSFHLPFTLPHSQVWRTREWYYLCVHTWCSIGYVQIRGGSPFYESTKMGATSTKL